MSSVKSKKSTVKKKDNTIKYLIIFIILFSIVLIATVYSDIRLITENIKTLCRQIKSIIPEDVIASFYLTFVERKSYPKNYESFLKQLSQEKVDKYALNQIVPVIIKQIIIMYFN